MSRVKTSLDDARMVVPARVDGAGRRTGGGSFSRGHLTAILGNPVYAGRLTHKREVHEGQPAALVDLATWDAVQARLAANYRGHTARRLASLHLLIGRIRDGSGTTMSPTHAQKGSRQYRYYVSRALLDEHKDRDAGSITRVSAPEIEAEVVRALRAAMPASRQPASDAELVTACLTHVSVHPNQLELTLANGADPIHLPWSPVPTRRRREIVVPAGTDRSTVRPMKVEDRARILKAIATGRTWMADRVAGPFAIASREGTSERSVRMMLSLAQLSPAIVTAIVEGRLPRGIGIRHLADLPAIWAEQHRALGL